MSTIIEKQREFMKEKGLDAMVAISPENVAYTAGFYVPSQLNIRSRHAMCVITADGPDAMISVDMEKDHVRAHAPFSDIRVYREFAEKPMDMLVDALNDLGLTNSRVSMELDYLPARDYAYLRDRVPNVVWVDAEAEHLYWDLRRIKTPDELDALREIGKIAERTHHVTFSKLRPGMTEKDLQRMVMAELFSQGVDRISVLIIGSGERSGFPNCAATERVIQEGDLVRMDILAVKNNYQSDVARTAIVGTPNEEQKKYWQMMVDTHKRTLELVKPGTHTDDIYAVYRQQFSDYGLPPANFLGHSLGLTAHEYPYIGIHGGETLQENMVLCMEPFWFGADVGMGYQLEDEVIVTSDGYELITDYAATDDMIPVPVGIAGHKGGVGA